MSKTKQEVLDSLNKFLSGNLSSQIQQLYKQGFINWIGKTIDTNELSTEILAHALLKHSDDIESITKITRKGSYKVASHFPIKIKPTNRNEEHFAKRITGLKIDDLGDILDYQVPLNNKQDDHNGKIDLVSLNKERDTFHLIELKVYNKRKQETLLRAVLEIYTYYKTVDCSRLLQDYQVDDTIRIVPTVLVYESEKCNVYKELEDYGCLWKPSLVKSSFFSVGYRILFDKPWIKYLPA